MSVEEMVVWLREQADTSEKGAEFFSEDDEALADDMMEDVRMWRKAADMLTLTEQALREIQTIQPATLERLRADSVVFNEMPAYDPSNWQQIAFWLYTELCVTETIAHKALDGQGE